MVGIRGLLAAATPFYNFCRPGGYFHGSRTNQEVVQKMYICMNNWILTFWRQHHSERGHLALIWLKLPWGFCSFWRFRNKKVPKFLRLMTNRFKYIFQNLKLSTRLLTALLKIFSVMLSLQSWVNFKISRIFSILLEVSVCSIIVMSTTISLKTTQVFGVFRQQCSQLYNVYIYNSHEQTRASNFSRRDSRKKKMSLPQAQIDQLKAFVRVLQAKPDLLHHPDLFFLKE